jgi:hypothetical protein
MRFKPTTGFFRVIRTSPTGTQESKTFYAENTTAAIALADAEDGMTEGWCEVVVPPALVLSPETLNILKAFSRINDVVILHAGHIQKVAGPRDSTAMFAVATLPDVWPKAMAIDLLASIKILSRFKQPTIQCDIDHLVITDADQSAQVTMPYAHASSVRSVADKSLPHDNPAVEWMLSRLALARLLKMAALLKATHITVAVEPERVTITAGNVRLPQPDTVTLRVTDVLRHDPTFVRSMQFRAGHIPRLADGDYSMALATWPYAVFTHMTLPVTYFIAEQRR